MLQPNTWGFKPPFNQPSGKKKKPHVEYPTVSHDIFWTEPEIPPTWKDSLFLRCLLLSLSKLFCFSSSSSFSKALICSSKQIRASSLSISSKKTGKKGKKKKSGYSFPLRKKCSLPKNPGGHGHTLELLILGKGGVVHEVLLGLWPGGAVGDVGHVIQDVLQSFPVPLPELLGLFLRGKVFFWGSIWGGLDRNRRHQVCSPRKCKIKL